MLLHVRIVGERRIGRILATTSVNTFAAASPAGTMNCWMDWHV
jgi:hypothetical protein